MDQLVGLLLAISPLVTEAVEKNVVTDCRFVEPKQTLHEFNARNIEDNATIEMSDYKGKVLLVVNLASF